MMVAGVHWKANDKDDEDHEMIRVISISRTEARIVVVPVHHHTAM
jgi:hypothetical protein